jgi:hypothetical protein
MSETGASLAVLAHLEPINLTPIFGNKYFGYLHFEEIHKELATAAPVVASLRQAQEALLALFMCEPKAFRSTGMTRKSGYAQLQDLDLAMQRTCFKSLTKDRYSFVREFQNSKENVAILPFVSGAFAAIYRLPRCSGKEIGRRLFAIDVPDPAGTHFMIALSRMLLALWRYAQSPR